MYAVLHFGKSFSRKLYWVKLGWDKFFLKKPPCIQSPPAMCSILPNITVTYTFLCSLLGSKHWRRLTGIQAFLPSSWCPERDNTSPFPTNVCWVPEKTHSPQTCSNYRLPPQSELLPHRSFFPPSVLTTVSGNYTIDQTWVGLSDKIQDAQLSLNFRYMTYFFWWKYVPCNFWDLLT